MRQLRMIKKGIVLKFDYEKTYDRVNWEFLEEMMVTRGFAPKWVKWVMNLVKNGSIAIRLNIGIVISLNLAKT
jgi:hypothetical protein